MTTFNTGNPVPSTDAKDLSDNAENFDSAVNTQSDTWQDRLGVNRDTVTGRLKKIGYAVPIVYAGGELFAVNDNVKTVDESGIIYAPLPSALPFTTSGTWGGDDDARFFVVQGVTNDQIINDLSQAYNFPTVLSLTDSAIAFDDDKVITVSEQNEHGIYDLATGQTANGRTILALADAVHFALQREYIESYEAFIWQVDPLGSDVFGNGVNGGAQAFLTPQFAMDSTATLINHQQTIQLADGTYNTSSRASGDDARPAVIQFSKKATLFRSALSGDDIEGPVIIKGNPLDNTAVIIQTTASYAYGIYNNGGQLGVQDLTITTSGANGGILAVSHRNTAHTYFKNCIVDSVFTTRSTAGVSTESGGILEWIDGKIRNCAIGAFAQTPGELMTFATRGEAIFENNTKGIVAKNNNWISLNSLQPIGKIQIIDSSNGLAIEAINGSHVSIRGNDGATNMCQIGAGINLDNATMDLVFSETLDFVTCENGGGVKYNASNYQKRISGLASDVWLATSNSYTRSSHDGFDNVAVLTDTTQSWGVDDYIGVTLDNITDGSTTTVTSNTATTMTGVLAGGSENDWDIGDVYELKANDDVDCVTLTDGGEISYTGTNNIIDFDNTYGVSYKPGALAYSGAAETKQIVKGRDTYEITSSGGTKADAQIDSTDIEEGRTIYCYGSVNAVSFIDGTHMDIGGPVLIGQSTGQYTGFTLIMIDQKWRLSGLGILRP